MAKYGTFHAVIGNGATFLAPITAYPTTTLTMALYNPTSDRVYKVKAVHSFLASGTPGAGGAILVCVTAVAQARPTLSTGPNGGYANTVISHLGGRGAPGDTQGVFINAITLTGPQPAWVAIAAEPAAGTGATIGTHGIAADVQAFNLGVLGGHMMGITYLSGAGSTPLYGFGVTWEEEDEE